jgi:DNA-binding beta-propeller fold protein YncE
MPGQRPPHARRIISGVAFLFVLSLFAFRVADRLEHVGKQPDGSFIVSSGQHISAGTIAFTGRPSDIAAHPGDGLFAVMKKDVVFLCTTAGVVPQSEVALGAEPGFHGLVWTPDGKRLIASTANGTLQTFSFVGSKLIRGHAIQLDPVKKNAVPGGMCITADGKSLFVACVDLNSVVQIDLSTDEIVRNFQTATMPFSVRLSGDEKTLVVSDWGGRIPLGTDVTAKSENSDIVVDSRGVPSSGVVTLIDRETGVESQIPVGIHPTDIVVRDQTAWVANALSDTVTQINLKEKKVSATIPLVWKGLKIFGAMPNALLLQGNTLYVADGGDNALAEVDLRSHSVKGFHPCGYFPIALADDGHRILVLNSKGNGSVSNTVLGKPGNAHNFQGTITLVDPAEDLSKATEAVAANNHWSTPIDKPQLAVYNGAIKHVIYIIKENRTYDEIYGDMEIGNGDPKLCDIGGKIMPNHQQIARDFTLFDNAYVSGTNSADGHAWSTQSLANDYLEHFYVGYSRTYSDDGACAMSLSAGGCIWDAAAKKHKSIRDYGEFVVADDAEYHPYQPKDWFEAWDDRQAGTHKFLYTPHTRVSSLKPYVCPTVHYWPLIQSDQARADEFIKEYTANSKADTVPNLTIMSLPSDHTEGDNPIYPAPKSMMADNDLALGRVVEAVSHSPQWKSTCIFVIEDDAQSGPDHVDGHRTSYLVISPFNKRHTVDSTLYTTTNMVRSIEMMLGLDPMNRFDSLSRPIDTCFNDTPDLTPYVCRPNITPLGLKNPGYKNSAMNPTESYWAEKTMSLDWSHPDAPDDYWLNRIIWASLHSDGRPYPAREGEKPGMGDTD